MIKNIMILVLLFAVAFLINIYYKKSSIKLDNDKLILNVKDKSIFLDYTLKKSENLTFSNLNVTIKKLALTGSNTFFEIATADSLYEFTGNRELIVKTIFEAEKINEIFSINGLSAIEVVLKNDKVVNLFVEENDIKELIFFYGLKTDLFIKTVKRLQGKDVKLLYQESVKTLLEPATHWSVQHNDIGGVIQSVDY